MKLSKYWLSCIFLSFFGLSAMEVEQITTDEELEQSVQNICDKIDECILEIPQDAWCKLLRGSFWSFGKSMFLSDENVSDGIRKINRCISAAYGDEQRDMKKIVKMLVAKHYYVHYLM